MLTALRLLFFPFKTWEKISLARRGPAWILFVYLMPLLVAAVALEGLSLVRFGETRGGLEFSVKISTNAAIRYSATQLTLILSSILMGAKFLQWITHSFQVNSTYAQCLNVMAYGFSPILLTRFLDALPGLNTWACWGLGALLASSVLYHGVALVLRPEQTKGFGIYLVSLIIVILSSLLTHLFARTVLFGKVWY